MGRLYGVYGVGGCGRSVIPLVRKQLQTRSEENAKIVFIDDNFDGSSANGYPVISFNDFVGVDAKEKLVSLAVSNGATRELLANKCQENGLPFFSVEAQNCDIYDDVVIGEGSILCSGVSVTSNIRIGRHFQANLQSYVEHDCVIGDFVTFAPGVKCNGRIRIEDHVFIGAGAVIRQGLPGNPLVIGRNACVGMGAVVLGDVLPNSTVVGVPARPI
jgi:sugar O-acyltransferase (sialic acid O-acetyltransferase NeuD family)